MTNKGLALIGVLLAASSGHLLRAQQTTLSPAKVADVKITFAVPLDPPPPLDEGGLPKEALYPRHSDSNEHGSFANLAARKMISSVEVTWADPYRFKAHTQIADLIRELLSNTKSETYAAHVWSNLDGMPCLTAAVDHAAGSHGRLVVWCADPIPANPPTRPYASHGTLKWAYQDGTGDWWWATWGFGEPLPKSMGTAVKWPTINQKPRNAGSRQ